jgi:RecQ-mediated genome instability protein 1
MAAPLITLSQLSSSISSLGLPTLSPTFLTPILHSATSRQPPPPLAALTATAKHRLLTADISSSTSQFFPPSTPSLPATITDVRTQQTALREDVFVQVLDIEDLGRSKWEQIEALEAERNGEMKKGREIIRVVPDAEGDPSTAATQVQQSTQAQNNSPKGPFKLLLQDRHGTKVYGFELKKVEKVGLPPVMSIGCKVMLRKGAKVARGMVLLEPSVVMIFGGKIEGLDKAWREGREQRLRRLVEADRAQADE